MYSWNTLFYLCDPAESSKSLFVFLIFFESLAPKWHPQRRDRRSREPPHAGSFMFICSTESIKPNNELLAWQALRKLEPLGFLRGSGRVRRRSPGGSDHWGMQRLCEDAKLCDLISSLNFLKLTYFLFPFLNVYPKGSQINNLSSCWQ